MKRLARPSVANPIEVSNQMKCLIGFFNSHLSIRTDSKTDEVQIKQNMEPVILKQCSLSGTPPLQQLSPRNSHLSDKHSLFFEWSSDRGQNPLLKTLLSKFSSQNSLLYLPFICGLRPFRNTTSFLTFGPLILLQAAPNGSNRPPNRTPA